MTAAELQQRIKEFAINVVALCDSLPPKKVAKIIEDQLIRSAFSAAANYRAACTAQSKNAFSAKLSIALEEADEAWFWLGVIKDLQLTSHPDLPVLIAEAESITKILGASRRTARKSV